MGRPRLRPIMGTSVLAAGSVLITLLAVEAILRFVVGLGDPLLYRSSPLYGYRLRESQTVSRRGIDIRVNNLGLRANEDWDSVRAGKVLFLGNSVTFGGTYVSNEELFSHYAVEGLPGYVSGNGGVNGWGVGNIHALVVQAEFLPAGVYVTVLQDMDFERGISKLAGQPFWTRTPSLAVEELLVLAGYHISQMAKEGHEAGVAQAERERAIAESVERLVELDEFLRSRGHLHLIYMSTDIYQLLDDVPRDPIVARSLDASGLRVRYLADRSDIRALGEGEIRALFYDWNHLDREGHRLWGTIIGEDLKSILVSGDGSRREQLLSEDRH